MGREQNYTIAEGFELPSKGLVYNKPVNPNMELRSFTARDEMKRTAPTNLPYKLLADILEGCLLEKPTISVYDMCLGDYEYLLHKARIISYGDSYKMTVQCPNCGKFVDAEMHLNELTVKDFGKETYDKLQTVTLPDSQTRVSLNYLTPRMLDERELKIKELKKQRRNAEMDFRTYVTLIQVIDLVDGEKLVGSQLENFINKLTAKDMLKILQVADKLTNSIGLDTRITAYCPECGDEFDTFFRIGLNFFRPDID